ncbi:molybdopterin molybdenumtransferase MoeA [Altericroceibacterium spongiae]|uniref:Molybdopterin molybdenumtransferase n=1 Tax=Altericroceibacterium spongiae TaxID=2320269 RepID=A0A420ERN7_9SPHN|nr:molybdopterin molybdotransferase MoeA [Altericroceibacterium spongiae]RKF23293.1 molybdopterin molybdenumtransferase MoeA [Altericroceibacterium spongiae]
MSLPQPLPLAEAQAKLIKLAQTMSVEHRSPAEAVGHYLADPLLARRTQPPADLSAMDGYAMRAGDVVGPWKLVGESAAGHPFADSLQAGEAIRISTGAILPRMAGAILLQEEAEITEGYVHVVPGGLATPRHIRRAGFDFYEDDLILEKGTVLGAPQIALALAGGHATLPVHVFPQVAIMDTGDELAARPDQCGPGQIPASNGAMLQAMARPYTSRIAYHGPIPDDLDLLKTALEQAGEADIIVTSGGASVGDHDLLKPAMEAAGFTLSFWRVAMKPGKPLMVGQKGRQIVLGLPGNPVSSYVTAYFFLLPLLRAMAGARQPFMQSWPMRLAENLPAGGKRLEFLRGSYGDRGISPVDGMQDSSALLALSRSDALIERPAMAEPAKIGDIVQVFPLDTL